MTDNGKRTKIENRLNIVSRIIRAMNDEKIIGVKLPDWPIEAEEAAEFLGLSFDRGKKIINLDQRLTNIRGLRNRIKEN